MTYKTGNDNDTLRLNLLKQLVRRPLFCFKGRRRSFLTIANAILTSVLVSFGLFGCGPSPRDLEAVDYTPLPGEDWEVSTPAEQGLDPTLVAELYYNAAQVETLQALLVIKKGTFTVGRWTKRAGCNR
jgi:hypothetical protein